MKTMKDYQKSDSIYFEDFFVPGDIVGKDVVENFRNVLPPATDNSYLMQMGEPHSHINGKPTYMTFSKELEGWKYCGNCFRGENENPFTEWLNKFLTEKDLDLSEEFTSRNDDGISKIFNYQDVIENIKNAPEKEQNQIQDMFIKIDYQNGNIKDFLQHLSKALIPSKEEVERLENIYGESIGIEKEYIQEGKIYKLDNGLTSLLLIEQKENKALLKNLDNQEYIVANGFIVNEDNKIEWLDGLYYENLSIASRRFEALTTENIKDMNILKDLLNEESIRNHEKYAEAIISNELRNGMPIEIENKEILDKLYDTYMDSDDMQLISEDIYDTYNAINQELEEEREKA